LAQANRVLEPKIERSQVIGVFAGLRPLVSSDPDSPTTELSREHVVDHPVPGFVTIAGGKYTTYRVMSEDAVDVAITDLKRIVPESCTETLAIVGADGYSVLLNKADELAKDYEISNEIVMHLLNRHGALFAEVLEPALKDKSLLEVLIPGLSYLKAEVLYAVTHEGARSVDDVLTRRTRINFEAKDQGLGIANEVAELIGEILGWSETQANDSVKDYEKQVRAQNDALAKTLSKSAK
jgi:glycerol-3-phosphate dehydrogenase